MARPNVEETISIADLLRVHPQIATLFIRIRVDCIGCSLNRFCTIADMCADYKLDPVTIWQHIQHTID